MANKKPTVIKDGIVQNILEADLLELGAGIIIDPDVSEFDIKTASTDILNYTVSTDFVTLGHASNLNRIDILSSAFISIGSLDASLSGTNSLGLGGNIITAIGSSSVDLQSPAVQITDADGYSISFHPATEAGEVYMKVASSVGSFLLFQGDLLTDSSLGGSLTIQAQNTLGSSTIGGRLILQSGLGTTNGAVSIYSGNTKTLECNGAGSNAVITSFVDNLNMYDSHDDLKFSINAGSSQCVLSFGPASSSGLLTHTQLPGTGAQVGANLIIQAQRGQNQSGDVQNNDGGNVAIIGGLPGSGGTGDHPAPISGSISLQSGSNQIGVFYSDESIASFTAPHTFNLTITGGCTITASTALVLSASSCNINTTNIGFFGTPPITKPSGVAVNDAAIHAALVSLGLIAA